LLPELFAVGVRLPRRMQKRRRRLSPIGVVTGGDGDRERRLRGGPNLWQRRVERLPLLRGCGDLTAVGALLTAVTGLGVAVGMFECGQPLHIVIELHLLHRPLPRTHLPAAPAPLGSPVFSVMQTDVIQYGADLLDYLNNELGPQGEFIRREPGYRYPPWSDFVMGPTNEDF